MSQPGSLRSLPERKLALLTGTQAGQRLAVTGKRQAATRVSQGKFPNDPLGVAVPELNVVLPVDRWQRNAAGEGEQLFAGRERNKSGTVVFKAHQFLFLLQIPNRELAFILFANREAFPVK